MLSSPASLRGKPRYRLPLLGGLILATLLAGCGEKHENGKSASTDPRTLGPLPITHRPERLDQIGEETCRTCHAEEFRSWGQSHHAHANRPIDPTLDQPAFDPTRKLVEGDSQYRMEWRDGKPWMIVDEGEGETTYPLDGVLAYKPLRQYLVPFPGGKWQTTTAAYDPAKQEWFDVYEGQNRRPGEWGHWTGQGMNWNANCAYCHNTEFDKNLDPVSGHYQSEWTRQSISCVQCHAGLAEHVESATEADGGILPRRLNAFQVEASCASCHSRRDDLTANEFRPGDSFHDHFGLTLPVYPDLYYADGQIQDEVFVFGSFEMSRMGHAGVTCMDCHDPHSMELTRPVANNSTCMWCHEGGVDGAPVIRPVEHSHHAEGSLGNRCVECHMPKTTYMQRDPRVDHGFHSPDPFLTRTQGIPNACSTCHTDESVEWAEEKVAEWYPEKKVLTRQRDRAQAIQAAWEGDPSIAPRLMELAKAEPIPAWRATYTGLLTPYAGNPDVQEFLNQSFDDPSSLVRSQAALAVGRAESLAPEFDDLLADPNRNVRLAAARTLNNRREPITRPATEEEWEEYLLFNSDRPQMAFILADRAIQAEDAEAAEKWLQRAIDLESPNPELLREAAILYSRLGNSDAAARRLEEAYSLAPNEAIYPYSLALIRAEQGRAKEALQLLKISTRLDPGFDRAWYNLALAQLRAGDPAAAYQSLNRATSLRGTENWIRAYQAIGQALQQQ